MKSISLILIFFLCFKGYADPVEHHPNVQVLCSNPRIYLIENFLTPYECDHIIHEARDQLTRSTVVENQTGKESIHSARTSQGMFLPQFPQDRILSDIEDRIARYTQIPVEHGEAIQVLHYGIGAEYVPHFDFFDPAIPGSAIHLKRGGQRVATLIMYLHTPEEGGETIFPKANIKVKPIKCNAVLFYNCTPEGKEDRLSLHGGAPVIKGEKWIATKWLRLRHFNGW